VCGKFVAGEDKVDVIVRRPQADEAIYKPMV
jgi:hypothetical protein